MSMRDFLDGDCGQNPVLKVASHFTRDTLTSDLGQSTSRHAFDTANGRDVGFLPPTTFQMDNLLKEIHSMGQTRGRAPIQAPPTIQELTAHPAWANEFLRHEQQSAGGTDQETWIQDYMSKDPELDIIWDNPAHFDGVPNGGPLPLMQTGHRSYPNAVHHPVIFPQHQPSTRDLLDDSNWAMQYDPVNSDIGAQQLEKTELMLTASEFLKSVSDPQIKATEFMNYVEKLSSGEIGADGTRAETRSVQWASEYENEISESEMQARRNGNWAEEYVTGTGGHTSSQQDEVKEEFWQKLNNEWEKLAQDDSISHPWLSEPSANKINEPYQFSDDNSFEDVEDPFEEGKRKLIAGDIPAAVLLFEAAAQKQPEHAESWMYLGTTQSLNEQDLLSISALNKCLQLEPNNLNALMSLASSLTNESFHLQACNALKRWLKYNVKYSNLVNEELGDTLPQTTSLLPSEELLKVQRMFIQAARINPSNGLDADVQCGLGILFNLNADFEKAADCFQSGVNVNPENPLLWNRLGATLANGGKSSEAIAAYRRALELSPGYIRTRYNLGIACVNLGAYREAAEHFLTALNMQANGKFGGRAIDNNKPSTMSESIWASLRTSLHLSDLSHLSRFIDRRDLDGLNKEFGSQS